MHIISQIMILLITRDAGSISPYCVCIEYTDLCNLQKIKKIMKQAQNIGCKSLNSFCKNHTDLRNIHKTIKS